MDPTDPEEHVHAVLRLDHFDPDRLAAAADQLAEFDRLHAAQPGFLGTATVELGGGRRFLLNLWHDVEDARRALPVLVPVVQRLVEPLLVTPSQLIGTGEVLTWPTGIRP